MTAKRRWLTREIVVETAVEMADVAGDVNAVTLSAVARTLNVRAPSLYNHVRGIDDLRQQMALYGVRRLIGDLQDASAGLTGRQALAAVAAAYRSFAQRHVGIYALTIEAPDADNAELAEAAQRLLQILLLILASIGVEGDDALHAVRGLRALLHGFVSLEVAEGFKMPLEREESFRRAVNTFVKGLVA